MNQLSNIENKLKIVLPISYKNTINKFQLFMEIEFNNYQINLFNEESLFDKWLSSMVLFKIPSRDK